MHEIQPAIRRLSSRETCLCVCLLICLSTMCWAQKPELVVRAGHSDGVTSVVFSADGNILASGGDHTIKLWDVQNGSELRTLSGHSDWVSSVALSADGKTLASGSLDNTIKLWDVTSGRELRTLKGHSHRVTSVAFTADGKMLVSGSWDCTIKVWDATRGRELRTLRGPPVGVTSVALSSDGNTLASASLDNTIKLWDMTGGRELRTLRGHSTANSVAFSADGKTLASGSSDGPIILWDVKSGSELSTLRGHSAAVSSVAFTADGKTLASGSYDHTVKLWDVTSGSELRTLRGHPSFVKSVTFGADGKTVASAGGGYDNTIKLWDVTSGSELRTLNGHCFLVSSVAFSPDEKTLAGGSADHTIKLWDVTTGSELRTLKGHSDSVFSVAFSADGKTLASGSNDRTIKLWDVTTGNELRTLNGHSGIVFSVAFSPDGKVLASGSYDKTVKLWDVTSGSELRTLEGHSFWVTSVAFSADGKTLASGSNDQTIKLWDLASGSELRTLKGHSSGVWSVAFNAGGRMLASGSTDETVKLWDVTSGSELRTMRGHSAGVYSLAFNADGKTLASGSADNTIKLWDVTSGRESRALKGHSFNVLSLAFSGDGKKLVSGSGDTSIRVWETNSGKELGSLIAVDQNDWLVITPDGLFDGSPNGWKQILWRFNNNTFDNALVEAFFKEYWRPGLLADIMSDKPLEPPRKDLSAVDIRQPLVRVTSVDGQAAIKQALRQPVKLANTVENRNVEITLEVVDNTKAPSRSDHPPTSGAKDLRLFRNGSLVRLWQGDTFDKRSGCELVAGNPNEPRRAVCKATVPIVEGDNEFTAYSFNHNDVKSSDAEALIKGAETLKRKGTAYIIAVGINEYANKEYTLNYAMHDAEDFSAENKRQQELLSRYQKVEVIPLYDRDATKKNILMALSLLGGTAELTFGRPEVLKLIRRAEPEDLVMVYFAGHGTAHENQYYLIPHDLGYDGSQQVSQDEALKLVLAHSISDRDLQSAFEKIDAGHLLLVIDACNSGQALEVEEKRRGPMNSKGLAQLAYEKGMYILTASQSFQAAQEVSELKHGLLTYVLVEEGLKEAKAEKNERGEIIARKWLDYATKRVPEKQIEKMKERGLRLKTGQIKNSAPQGKPGAVELVFVEGDDPKIDPEKRTLQRPRVFYRRELEAKPLIVAH